MFKIKNMVTEEIYLDKKDQEAMRETIRKYGIRVKNALVTHLDKNTPNWSNEFPGLSKSQLKNIKRDKLKPKQMAINYIIQIFNNKIHKKRKKFSPKLHASLKKFQTRHNSWKHTMETLKTKDMRSIALNRAIQDIKMFISVGHSLGVKKRYSDTLESWQRKIENRNDSEPRGILAVNVDVTYHETKKYYIYSCPSNRLRYKFAETNHITFFDQGGEMDAIYAIDKIVRLTNPQDLNEYRFKRLRTKLSKSERLDLLNYARKMGGPYAKNDKHYILSRQNVTKLKPKKKSTKGAISGQYFTFEELESRKRIVKPYKVDQHHNND